MTGYPITPPVDAAFVLHDDHARHSGQRGHRHAAPGQALRDILRSALHIATPFAVQSLHKTRCAAASCNTGATYDRDLQNSAFGQHVAPSHDDHTRFVNVLKLVHPVLHRTNGQVWRQIQIERDAAFQLPYPHDFHVKTASSWRLACPCSHLLLVALVFKH
jgi:hypothetical protein